MSRPHTIAATRAFLLSMIAETIPSEPIDADDAIGGAVLTRDRASAANAVAPGAAPALIRRPAA